MAVATNFCPACGTPSGGAPFCNQCGRDLASVAGAPHPSVPVNATHPPSVTTPLGPGLSPDVSPGYEPRPISQGTAILALILNIIIWPGLGSLVVGEKVGWAQGFLFLAGIPLSIVIIGIPMLIGAWIWGIVTGAQLLSRASP